MLLQPPIFDLTDMYRYTNKSVTDSFFSPTEGACFRFVFFPIFKKGFAGVLLIILIFVE